MLALNYKTILSVALPMMVTGFIQSIVLLTDASMIARYSTEAFDAVGNAGLMYVTLFMCLAGMADGAQIIIARRIGQDRPQLIGQVFGSAAYPFLKVHEGNQSYYLSSTAFNKLNFFEFISDRYVGGYVEQHFGGLFFNRMPYVKKLKLRLVASSRATYGSISDRNIREMVIPTFTKKFDKLPYAEATVGIENILKVLRVDLVWRLTYIDPGMNPLGIRGKLVFNF